MKKTHLIFLISALTATTACADIHYCHGTHVARSKHTALQFVIHQFAEENHCVLSYNCIQNFDDVKYSIAWGYDCDMSASLGNDPKGSTFVCENGLCYPLGFSTPSASYLGQ